MIDPGKAQWVRLLDVFFLGPLMVWGGIVVSEKHAVAGPVLAAFGLTTIGYNAFNYLRLKNG